MLSSACQYAIRSVLYLAIHSGVDNKLGFKVVAKELGAPQPFIAKTLQKLSRENLVTSAKGPTGGFFLSESNKQNTIWDIVICIDGEEKINRCFLGLNQCDGSNPCPMHDAYVEFKEKMFVDFKFKTIEVLAQDISAKGIVLRNFNLE